MKPGIRRFVSWCVAGAAVVAVGTGVAFAAGVGPTSASQACVSKTDQRLALLNSDDRCAYDFRKITIGTHVDIVPIPANHKKGNSYVPATLHLPQGNWLVTSWAQVEDAAFPPTITNGEPLTPFDGDLSAIELRIVVKIDRGGGAITLECYPNRTRGYVAYTYQPVDVTRTTG